MSTIVFFHAHPDDEAISCGGTMLQAAQDGHRVVLVCATRGENGEVEEGFLEEGETLGDRRVKEQEEAAAILGAARVEFLGYVDSGMMGTPENDHPGSFWQADVEEAAARLTRILEEENADVLTIYDENGTYGHPDHMKVHHVGVRAAAIAGTPKVYESVVARERIERMAEAMRAMGIDDMPDDDIELGVPEATITLTLDVRAHLPAKRRAMAAHASQIPPSSFFLTIPPEFFESGFGYEEYRLRGAPSALTETSLFDGLPSRGSA